MSSIMTIAWKEFKGFVKNPTFYIMMALLTLILSLLFTVQMQKFFQLGSMAMTQPGMGAQLNIHYTVFLNHLQILNLLLILDRIKCREINNNNSSDCTFSTTSIIEMDFLIQIENCPFPPIIDGLLFKNNFVKHSSSPIFATNFSSLLLKNITLEGLSPFGAITIKGAVNRVLVQILIDSSIFKDCSTDMSGAALSIFGAANSKIVNSKFINNKALRRAGAIYLREEIDDSGFIDIENCLFS